MKITHRRSSHTVVLRSGCRLRSSRSFDELEVSFRQRRTRILVCVRHVDKQVTASQWQPTTRIFKRSSAKQKDGPGGTGSSSLDATPMARFPSWRMQVPSAARGAVTAADSAHRLDIKYCTIADEVRARIHAQRGLPCEQIPSSRMQLELQRDKVKKTSGRAEQGKVYIP